MSRRVAIAILASLLATPAVADDSVNAACELHIWPAAGLRFSDQGMWDNFRGGVQGGIIGELASPEGRMERSDRGPDAMPETASELMGTAEQIELFKTLSDASALGLPAHHAVVHYTTLTSRDIRNTPGRYEPASSPCYADLVLDTLLFSNEWGNGQNLKSLYRFRDFGTGTTAIRSFGAWVDTRLIIEPEELPAKYEDARTEMRAAFIANIVLFGAALQKNAATTSKQGRKK